jgi:hypothetical protein
MPQNLTLPVWAKNKFGDDSPHIVTLRRWVREGRIYPLPKKIGKTWFVVPNAEYLEN